MLLSRFQQKSEELTSYFSLGQASEPLCVVGSESYLIVTPVCVAVFVKEEEDWAG